MVEEHKIKAHLEFENFKVDVEGEPDEVFHAVVDFLNRVFPSLKTVLNITFTVDFMKLMEDASGILKVAPEGPILASGINLAADDAITSSLVGAYLGYELKKLPDPSLSIQDLSKIIGKTVKTVSNQIAGALKEGIVKKVGKGRYQITNVGVAHFQETIIPRLKALKGEEKIG